VVSLEEELTVVVVIVYPEGFTVLSPFPRTISLAARALSPERVTGFVKASYLLFQVYFSPVVTNDKSFPSEAADLLS